MSDALSGVFLCSGFCARQSIADTAFVKPVNIRVYSAPPPVRMRVITYNVRYTEGDEQPSEAAHWTERGKDYQSPFTGERSFSFTTGTLETTLDELLTRIRRHFYAVVLKGEMCRGRTEAFSRMMEMNTADRRYNIDDETVLRVYDVHHVRAIDVNDAGVHVEVKADTRYRGNLLNDRGEPMYAVNYKDRFISVAHTYADGRKLLTSAVNHFKQPEVQDRILTAVAETNA